MSNARKIKLLFLVVGCVFAVACGARSPFRFPLIVLSGNYPAPNLTYGFRYYVFVRLDHVSYRHVTFMDGGGASWSEHAPAYTLDVSLQAVQPFSPAEHWGMQFETRWCSFQFREYTNMSSNHYRLCRFRSKLNAFAGCIMIFTSPNQYWITGGISYTLPVVWRFRWNLNCRYNFALDESETTQVSMFQVGLQIQFNPIPWRWRGRWI